MPGADWQSDPQDYIGGALGVPVTITSGYRTAAHNAAVGGVPNSAHLSGQAFDFVPKGIDTKTAAQKLAASGIPFDQLINEGDHVHVSFAPAMRGQVLNVANAGFDFVGAINGSGAAPAQAQGSGVDFVSAIQNAKGGGTPAPKAAPPPTGTQANAVFKKPFGFSDYVSSKIPFAQDASAGAVAGLDTLANLVQGQKGQGFGESYRANINQLQANQQAYEQAHPILSNIGSVIGIMAAGKPSPASVPGGGGTILARAKEGAKGGATLGAIFGAGTPTGPNETLDQRLAGAAGGTIVGGATGGTLPVLGAGLAAGGRAAGQVVNKLIPSVDQVAANKAKAIIDQFAGGPVQSAASQLVPGSLPTLAEASANPGVASLTRAIRDINPNSPLIAREAQNQAARQAFAESVSKTPEELTAAIAARDKAGDAARNAVFAQAKAPADVTPIIQQVEDTLSGSSGNRPAVKSAMNDVKAMMTDSKGNPITDPKTLYDSVRKGINDLISGKDLTKSYGAQAASELIAVRDKLDDAIEAGAPGFKKYLEDYSAASSPIDAMKFLQGQDLTDTKGNITLGKVQTALKRLTAQQAAPGVKAGKNVTSEQVQALENLRDDLLRSKNIELGKAIGSNTVQNLMAQKRLGLSRFIPEGLGLTIGTGIGHLAGNPEIGGFLGDRLGNMAGSMIQGRQQASQALLQSHLEDMLLNPERYQNSIRPTKFPTLNDIMNDSRMRASIGAANRLAILHELGRKNRNAGSGN